MPFSHPQNERTVALIKISQIFQGTKSGKVAGSKLWQYVCSRCSQTYYGIQFFYPVTAQQTKRLLFYGALFVIPFKLPL